MAGRHFVQIHAADPVFEQRGIEAVRGHLPGGCQPQFGIGQAIQAADRLERAANVPHLPALLGLA